MTAKRFMLDDCGELIDLNNHKFVDYGEECCNLLNEQHETIERLKENIDELLSVNVEEELLKENEQLKQRNKRLEYKIQRERTSFTKTHERWSKEAETKIKELSEENEQLKQSVIDWIDRKIEEIKPYNSELCRATLLELKELME